MVAEAGVDMVAEAVADIVSEAIFDMVPETEAMEAIDVCPNILVVLAPLTAPCNANTTLRV